MTLVKMRYAVFLLLFVVIPFSQLLAVNTITADNSNFQYTGRIDFSDPGQPVFFWPGTYVKAKFEGSLLIVMLNDQTGNSFYDVYIDNDFDNPHLINCSAGSNIYLVSGTLENTGHSMLLFRRTEASTGSTIFEGIQIDNGKNILPPDPRPEHKIVFYGNSITCGYGNEAPDNMGDDNPADENNFLAYGAIASRLLGAEYMCIAKSGIGIIISWFDLIMPEYYYRLNPEDPNSVYDFDLFPADVVVINLFQNDSWLIGNIHPTPDSAQIVMAYVDFVRLIRQHHPDAFIVCALGSMDATREGSPWPGYIESAVDYMKINDDDSNLDTYFFPFDPAWTKHPRVRHHLVMGENLSNYIYEQTGWVNDVDEHREELRPAEFSLSQNYPNPFNPSTIIKFNIPSVGTLRETFVQLKVYDVLGNEVANLVDEFRPAGAYEVELSTSDGAYKLSSGVYFYQLKIDGQTITRKMILMK
ncbi:MAG TPA: T9SS type A sorting domain-containing protein [Ignavibacteriaceae bacterium]|nr:T9SS type A sorting domain-containing protein [Ignavibacteriaceae bacterium]